MGPGGEPLPFASEDEVRSFLETARVVRQKELTSGVNRPLKVLLEQDGTQANAIFRIVDIRHKRGRLDGKLIADFHDSYIYECAAYEVSRMLGLDNVPPCVDRRHEHSDGTMQLWIENAMTEEGRRKSGKEPPSQLHWLRQKQTMRLFDGLIYNFDRNQGNMLIDAKWKLWFIDHTRSFRTSALVENIEKIIWCERDVWQRLQALEKAELARRLRPYGITSPKLATLLKRRDQLVDHLRGRIKSVGEAGVIYDRSDEEIPATGLPEIADDDIPLTSSKLEAALPGDGRR